MKNYVFCSECKYCEICSAWNYGILDGCFGYADYYETKKSVKSDKRKSDKNVKEVEAL
jgi:hypothetical protein